MSVYPVLFQAPSQEGINFGDPDDVADYLSSLSMALARALDDLARQTNDPRQIMIPTGDGRRPLSGAGVSSGWYPGDVKLTLGSKASPSYLKARRQEGWVPLNGLNGTVNMSGAFAKGAAIHVDPGVEGGSSADITTGGPSSLIQVIGSLTCDTQIQAGDATHTHDADVDDNVNHVTFVFLMKV